MAIITTTKHWKRFFYLQYGWEPTNILKEYVCKVKYNIDYALTCKICGFINNRHNEIV